MTLLSDIVNKLNREFNIKAYGKDAAFSRFIPSVYDPIQYDWKAAFEPDFTELFNGIMLRGAESVERVFLAVFPTDHVLERFIEDSTAGDLLFMHHPLLMECGDPKGQWGNGFVPIKEKYIGEMKAKKVSVYTCHVPMDYHRGLGTNTAIAQALNAEIVGGFLKDDLIWVCKIDKTSTEELIASLKEIFDIPYVDFEGQHHQEITKIAIIAGCGDKVDWMKEAETLGVQAYITGEIHCHIDNDYGRSKFNQMMEYVGQTSMSLIGVSHSASEYLVVKTLMKNWFEHNFGVETILIPQEKWWL